MAYGFLEFSQYTFQAQNTSIWEYHQQMFPKREVKRQAMMNRLCCSMREEGKLGGKTHTKTEPEETSWDQKPGCSPIQSLTPLCNSILPSPRFPPSPSLSSPPSSVLMYPRMTVNNSWSSCFYPLSTVITSVHHRTAYMALEIEPSASWILGRYSTYWAIAPAPRVFLLPALFPWREVQTIYSNKSQTLNTSLLLLYWNFY